MVQQYFTFPDNAIIKAILRCLTTTEPQIEASFVEAERYHIEFRISKASLDMEAVRTLPFYKGLKENAQGIRLGTILPESWRKVILTCDITKVLLHFDGSNPLLTIRYAAKPQEAPPLTTEITAVDIDWLKAQGVTW